MNLKSNFYKKTEITKFICVQLFIFCFHSSFSQKAPIQPVIDSILCEIEFRAKVYIQSEFFSFGDSSNCEIKIFTKSDLKSIKKNIRQNEVWHFDFIKTSKINEEYTILVGLKRKNNFLKHPKNPSVYELKIENKEDKYIYHLNLIFS